MAIRRILLASDTGHPEVNGVVRTLDATVRELTRAGCEVRRLEPALLPSVPCPLYPGFRLAWPGRRRLEALVEDFSPDAIHVATEAGVGLCVRAYCLARGLRFTTAFHTRSPEYLWRMACIPPDLTYRYLRWFHSRSAGMMVAVPSVEAELRRRGFGGPFRRWSRGVDLGLFHPRPRTWPAEHRPVQLYVGRVSVEKNLGAFLGLKTAGKKYVVGDGPARQSLQAQYPGAVFLGRLEGERLAEAYANADVFVFPSRTDTFGLVILEALASGVPVAAYPAPGPADILTDPRAGALHPELGQAVAAALHRGDPAACIALAAEYRWERSAQQFRDNLVLARQSAAASAITSSPRRALAG
jgi:glycosyltransferase involved in cell wall biosynthesis